MDLVNALKTQTSTSREKAPYSLNEILAILHMFTVEKLKPAQVAEITGRSVHSLRYKFLEGEIVLNGKKQIRSMKRFNTVQEIFTHSKVEYVDNDDVVARIKSFRDVLTNAA